MSIQQIIAELQAAFDPPYKPTGRIHWTPISAEQFAALHAELVRLREEVTRLRADRKEWRELAASLQTDLDRARCPMTLDPKVRAAIEVSDALTGTAWSDKQLPDFPSGYTIIRKSDYDTIRAALVAKGEGAKPVAWTRTQSIVDGNGCPIGTDESEIVWDRPEIVWGSDRPDPDECWFPLFDHPAPVGDIIERLQAERDEARALLREWRENVFDSGIRPNYELLARIEAALARTGDECTIGVGDGSGNLFVHGSYESIKALQALLLTRKVEAEPVAWMTYGTNDVQPVRMTIDGEGTAAGWMDRGWNVRPLYAHPPTPKAESDALRIERGGEEDSLQNALVILRDGHGIGTELCHRIADLIERLQAERDGLWSRFNTARQNLKQALRSRNAAEAEMDGVRAELQEYVDAARHFAVEKAENRIRAETAERSLAEARKDAERYRWLREQVKSPEARTKAQAIIWNYSSRGEFDRAIDAILSRES
jgi:hypothetical protein